MKSLSLRIISLCLFLSSCATYQVPEFPRNWRPINELSDKPISIPLIQKHIYRATQLDTTLRGLLIRWGNEAKMPVVYDYPSDFTLFKPVLNIESADLNDAINQLSKLYEPQGLNFRVQDNVIVVSPKE